MIIFLFLIALIPAIIGVVYGTRIKGWFGEHSIALKLSRLDSAAYTVINNIVLDIQGKTVQIDHLVVSDFGLFIIETKNYNGWIVGSENSSHWTQVIYQYKYKFYNPVLQNRGHLKALQQCLPEYANIRYLSIVVFTSGATIKLATTTAATIYDYQLLHVIKGVAEPNLSAIQKQTIIERINLLNVAATYDRRKHNKSIRQKIQKREQSVRNRICPQCGGELAVRYGRFGQFVSCRQFPSCKYKAKI